MYFSSVINTPAWNRAKWEGTVFGVLPEAGLPFVGPMFGDESAARMIFEEWTANIGEEDLAERIRVSVVESSRDGSDPSYHVHIGVNVKALTDELESERYMMMVSRHHKMVPQTASRHLQEFKKLVSSIGSYLLLPAIMQEDVPVPIFDLALKKKEIHFRYIDEIVDRNDPDVILVPGLVPESPELPKSACCEEPPDRERITAILMDFERKAMTGTVSTHFDPMILDRLYSVERDSGGLVVPESVDPIKKLIAESGTDTETFSHWAAEKPEFRKRFAKNANDLFDALSSMWAEYAPVVIFHLNKMRSLKAVYGGSGFPLKQSRFWSNVLLYTDTLVVPDPILGSYFMAKTATPEESLYHHCSHCLNALEYADLATSGLSIPPLVFAPTLGIIHDRFREIAAEKAGGDLARHMSKLFGYRMETMEEVETFFCAAGSVPKLLSAIQDSRFFLLNDKVPREPEKQAKENLEYISTTFNLPGASDLDMIRLSLFGRWLQYELLCGQASALGGLPIMDASAVWEYFTWGLEMGGGAGIDGDALDHMVIQQSLHGALAEFPFVSDLSVDAALELRRRDLLGDLRTLIREGIGEVGGADRASCEHVTSRVAENIRQAVAKHTGDIAELQKLGTKLAFESVGSGTSMGLSIAAAATGSVPLAAVAAVIQGFGVKSIRNIGKDGQRLLSKIKKHQSNPIGLLFR